MRSWTPQTLYDAKLWLFIGMALVIGMTVWSLAVGYWSMLRGLPLFAGAALAIVGGPTLQLRQDYRARSKWRRESPR